jgi:hypothetical protein
VHDEAVAPEESHSAMACLLLVLTPSGRCPPCRKWASAVDSSSLAAAVQQLVS